MAFDPPQKLGDDAGEGAPNAPTASGAAPGTPNFRQTVGAILPEPQRGFNRGSATAVLHETWGWSWGQSNPHDQDCNMDATLTLKIAARMRA